MSRVSALKVRVFATCRLRFRYQYVDRVKARLRPADTAGSLVHRVLCDIYAKVPRDERNEPKLIALFEEGWGALSPNYFRVPGGVEMHREASLSQLRNFARVFGLDREPLEVEPYFQVQIDDETTLFGRLDRIDEEPDRTLHIIDYKGGTQPGEIDPDQLRLYALLAEMSMGRTVSKASFWYLDDGTSWTMDLDKDEKRRTREGLLVTVQDMERVAEFPPTIGPHCEFCPYYKVCEFKPEIDHRAEREGWW
ncbi:MAG TPA: PD-(D/E)XK nuclease family protein [Dehalococcoidia bacterium]|nr:PD-(D/E)XK nuclease family protein [Dehalococcoidia bacterium]